MKEVSKRVWIVGLMILFIVSAEAQELPSVKEARRLFDIDQPSKSLSTLNEAVKTNPADAVLLYYLGTTQLKTGDRQNAEISFQKGLDLNPKEALNIAGKGQARMAENNAVEAKTLFDQALSMTKSKNASVLKAVATGYLMNDKFTNEALALLTKAKSISGNDPQVLILLGDTYLKLNDGGKAVSNYENAATAEPKNALGHYKSGLVYLRSKNYEVAEQNFNKAIQVDPNYTLAYKELGELYYQMGNTKAVDAVKAYENYLRLTEKPQNGQLRYAFFLFMAKDYKKANGIFKELSLRPDVTPTVWKYSFYSLVESGELELSEEAFNQYITKTPVSEIEAKDYVYHGQMLIKQGKDSLAIISFNNSLALEKNANVAQLAGESLFKLKRYDEAIVAYQLVDSIRTTLTSPELFSLGKSYYFTAQYGKADTTFQKLIALQPNMAIVYLWQARSVANLDPEVNGKIKGLAKPIFEKVVEKGIAEPAKNKKDLIEAYSYLGYYHVLKNELAPAKSFFEKILQLDPSNVPATEFLKEIKKPKKAN